ncbi:hypothetical protein BOX15_Mlig002937g3 [Macrostomum lignano]|uniref:Uncharacterized protein n=1 Tax=Macrostomum lignano TaxID=282301 RepID=A0A267DHM0_9PLAT|nr:hypothetical protein BOX15_Mlig002937g3 [Macrostomum lignano]
MIPSNIGYAERYLAAQNNEIMSNRSAQSAPEDQDFVWERGRKLSADTNKRRKRQEQKQRREADSEEKRRQEILELRRLKLKEATEKYQRCRGTRKAVERRNRSNSATRHDFGYSNKELEDTLRLLQGGSGGLQRFGSHDGLNGRAGSAGFSQTQPNQPPPVPPQHQKPPPSGGATASFLEKYGGGGGSGSRPMSSTSNNRGQQQQQQQKQQNQKSLFEQQLADFQQKKWESQKRSMLDFQQDLESTLQSAAPPPQVAEEDEPADEDQLNDSLNSARTYDRFVPEETPAPAPRKAAEPAETFESFDSTAALRPELFRAAAPNSPPEPQPEVPEKFETEPRGILKKQTSYSSDGGSSSTVEIPVFLPPQSQPAVFSEARAGRLRDSVEISRVTLNHHQQEPAQPGQQAQQQQQDDGRKKSVRFAETLFEEQLLHPRSPETQPPQPQPRGETASNRAPRPTSGRPTASQRAAQANGEQQLAACGTRMLQGGRAKLPQTEATPLTAEPSADSETPPPPPSPTTTSNAVEGFFPEPAAEEKPRQRVEVCIPNQATTEQTAGAPSATSVSSVAASAAGASKPPVPPATSGPGYAALMSKKPPKPYKPRARPVKVTSSTLNRLVASPQSGAAPVPPNVATPPSDQLQPPQPQLRSGPLPKRTVSDPNLSQQQQQQQQQQPISLDRTPTDQEIDFLWSQVRECLNRSTSSLATESDASVRSAPVPRVPHQPVASHLLIDGSNLMMFGGPGGSARVHSGSGLPPRVGSAALLQHRQPAASRFLEQNQLLTAQQRRQGLAGVAAARQPTAASERPPLPPSSTTSGVARQAFNEPTAPLPQPRHSQQQQQAGTGNSGSFAPVSDSLAEFLANEMALSSVDGSASSSPRGSASSQQPPVQAAPAAARPASSVRRGVMLRHRQQNSPLSLNLMTPPMPQAEAAPAQAASRQQQPSQLSLEEQRLMKSLDRLNTKLGSDRS